MLIKVTLLDIKVSLYRRGIYSNDNNNENKEIIYF